jgi:hypothetical protein
MRYFIFVLFVKGGGCRDVDPLIGLQEFLLRQRHRPASDGSYPLKWSVTEVRIVFVYSLVYSSVLKVRLYIPPKRRALSELHDDIV